MRQLNAQVGQLPLGVGFREDGTVVLMALGAFNGIVDAEQTNEVTGVYSQDGMTLVLKDSREEFSYNVAYPLSLYPLLKKWLTKEFKDVV